MTPRQQLTSVPYAMSTPYVAGSGGGWVDDGGTIRLETAGDNVGIGIATAVEKLQVVGTVYSSNGGFKFPDGTVQTTSGIPEKVQNTFSFITYESDPLSGMIAYGKIAANGTVYSATANVSCTWDSGSKRYEITISGHSYFYLDYVTVVTPSGDTPCMATTNSIGGKLLVFLFATQ